jgi:hypothetical protein
MDGGRSTATEGGRSTAEKKRRKISSSPSSAICVTNNKNISYI